MTSPSSVTRTMPSGSISRCWSIVDDQVGPNQRPAVYPDSARRLKTRGSVPGRTTSVWGRYIRPVAKSMGSVLPLVLVLSGRSEWCGPSVSSPLRAGPLTSSRCLVAVASLLAAPVPLEPMASAMSLPTPSVGSFMNSSSICLPAPTGSLAMTTRPAAVELRLVRYSAGWDRLYRSSGLRPRAKLTTPADPLTRPPTRWVEARSR